MCKILLVKHSCQHLTYRPLSRCRGIICFRHSDKPACTGGNYLEGPLISIFPCGECEYRSFELGWKAHIAELEGKIQALGCTADQGQSSSILMSSLPRCASPVHCCRNSATEHLSRLSADLASALRQRESEQWLQRRRYLPHKQKKLDKVKVHKRTKSPPTLSRELLPEDIPEAQTVSAVAWGWPDLSAVDAQWESDEQNCIDVRRWEDLYVGHSSYFGEGKQAVAGVEASEHDLDSSVLETAETSHHYVGAEELDKEDQRFRSSSELVYRPLISSQTDECDGITTSYSAHHPRAETAQLCHVTTVQKNSDKVETPLRHFKSNTKDLISGYPK